MLTCRVFVFICVALLSGRSIWQSLVLPSSSSNTLTASSLEWLPHNSNHLLEESFSPPRVTPKRSEVSTTITPQALGTQETAQTQLKSHPKQPPRSSSGFFFPRVVVLEFDMEAPDDNSFVHVPPKQRPVEPMTTTLVLLPENMNATSTHVQKLELSHHQQNDNECQPILNDVRSVHPTCNSLHELDFVGDHDDSSMVIPISLLSMSGSWRSAWRVDDQQVPVVLKVLLLKQKFTQESFAMHAIDARTMERLTASPNVVDIYSFCGQSQLSEFGNTARLGIKDPTLRSMTRLLMARDLARGLADLHAYRPIHDYQRNNNRSLPAVVFAHYDINPANVVLTNRTMNGGSNSSRSEQTIQIKWNDFNLGVPLQQNRNGTACQIPVRLVNPLWRSPEEIQNTTGGLVHGGPADVYSFGNLLFLILARHQPWSHLETEKLSIETIMQKKMAGEVPNMPSRYIDKMEAKILWEAIQACYRLDPQTRPTAYELASAIGTAYNWIRKKKQPITIESVRALFEKKNKTKRVSE
jgi:hypothetical protein